MRGDKLVVGIFTYLDDTIKAVEYAKNAGHEIQVYAPTYIHELEHAVDSKRSPVARFTLVGAICGLSAGFGLACWTALDYPMRVSAKDIIAPPAFIVVGYEWTILWGVLFTLIGIGILSKVPSLFRDNGYDPRLSDDKYGLSVNCQQSEVQRLQAKFMEIGADEVEVRNAL